MGHVPTGEPRIVLIVGVSRRLGARLATVLQADPRIARIIGVDTQSPAESLGRTEFVRADLRTSSIAALIESAGADTVVHTGLVTAPASAGGRGQMKEINVIGTIKLLAACERSPTVRRLVVRSTTVVYGSSPHAPALFTEEMQAASLPRHGYARDASDVEGYVRDFARRRPDVSVTTLRFANFMGPGVDSPLTRYFALPVVPTVLGFDPRLQFVHADDGLEVLRRTALEDHPGTYNVSGAGVLMLSQAIRRAGRPSLPVPATSMHAAGEALRRLGVSDFSPEQMALLRHGRAVDASAVQEELNWRPAYTTVGAFDEFVRQRGMEGAVPVDALGRIAERLTGRPAERPARPDASAGNGSVRGAARPSYGHVSGGASGPSSATDADTGGNVTPVDPRGNGRRDGGRLGGPVPPYGPRPSSEEAQRRNGHS